MVNHWIFVSTEYSDFNRASIIETLRKADNEKKWPIGRRTPHRMKIKKADIVLIYSLWINLDEVGVISLILPVSCLSLHRFMSML